jgi:hypothetical protein
LRRHHVVCADAEQAAAVSERGPKAVLYEEFAVGYRLD